MTNMLMFPRAAQASIARLSMPPGRSTSDLSTRGSDHGCKEDGTEEGGEEESREEGFVAQEDGAAACRQKRLGGQQRAGREESREPASSDVSPRLRRFLVGYGADRCRA